MSNPAGLFLDHPWSPSVMPVMSSERQERIQLISPLFSSLKFGYIPPDLTSGELNAMRVDFKEEGNSCFKEGAFNHSYEWYTGALTICKHLQVVLFVETDPKFISIVLSNRAACLLKMDHFQEGMTDCEIALQQNPDNLKAHFRFAQAKKFLRDYVGALQAAGSGRDRAVKDKKVTQVEEFDELIREIKSHLPSTSPSEALAVTEAKIKLDRNIAPSETPASQVAESTTDWKKTTEERESVLTTQHCVKTELKPTYGKQLCRSMNDDLSASGRIEEMVECCICRDVYSDPRILPCIHSFCLKCLEKTFQEKKPDQAMACPLCRKEFDIPQAGLTGLPKNFFIEQLIDIHHSSNSDSLKFSCDGCLEENKDEDADIPLAVKSCEECKQKLCEDCVKAHLKVKVTKNHKLVDLNPGGQRSKQGRKRNNCCTHHENEEIKMYCHDCKTVICMICHVESHQGHKCSGVVKAGEEFRTALRSIQEKTTQCLSESQTMERTIDEEVSECLSNIDALQKEVVGYADALRKNISFLQERHPLQKFCEYEKNFFDRQSHPMQLVDEHLASLITVIESFKSTKMKEFQNRKNEVICHSQVLASFNKYANEMIEKGSHVDVCRTFVDMKLNAVNLEKEHTSCMETVGSSRKHQSLRFVKEKFTVYDGPHQNVIGRLEPVGFGEMGNDDDLNSPIDYASSDIQLLERIQIELKNVSIAGLTWLENKLYIICSDSNKVIVHDGEPPFDRLPSHDIEVKSLDNPYDITACKGTRMLFISNSVPSKYLWRIRLSDKQVTKRPFDGEPRGLSTTPLDELMIVLQADNSFHLDVYMASTGKPKRIPLPAGIDDPSNAVKSSRGTFIMSWSAKTEDDWLCTRLVVELMLDGKIIRTFKLASTMSVRSLPFYHLSMDDHDRVFIANWMGDCVLLLNAQMTDVISLLSPAQHEICRPTRVFYLPEKRQLMVGQWWSMTSQSADVSIFQFSPRSESAETKTDFQLEKIIRVKGEEHGVCGVVWLDNQIYVSCFESTVVHVFSDQKPFKESQDIDVLGMKDPYDMVASEGHQTIFISDGDGRRVWTIQMPGRVIKCLGIQGGEPWGLSIHSPDILDVLVVRSNPKRFHIDVYKICGSGIPQWMSSILLPTDIIDLTKAVRSASGTFFISPTTKNIPDLNIVREISGDGKEIIREFNPSTSKQSIDWYNLTVKKFEFVVTDVKNRRIVEMGKFFTLDCDSKYWAIRDLHAVDDKLLVVDYTGRRILMLNAQLNDVRVLLNKDDHQIERPSRVCYVKRKKLLIVGQWSTYNECPTTFSIFSLRRPTL